MSLGKLPHEIKECSDFEYFFITAAWGEYIKRTNKERSK